MTLSRDDPRIVRAAHTDPVLRAMLKDVLPLTRKVWLELNYGEEPGPHDGWSAEQEQEVPEPLRDWSQLRERR